MNRCSASPRHWPASPGASPTSSPPSADSSWCRPSGGSTTTVSTCWNSKVATGHSILYSHFFLFVGLAILASVIRHAILGELNPADFRRLVAAGTVLFFLGKQYGYYMEVPELRPYLRSNTAAVFALTALVLMLPVGLEAMLVGVTATMICYVLLNLRYRHLVHAGPVPA